MRTSWLVFLLLPTLFIVSCDSAPADPDEAPFQDDGSAVVGTLGGIVFVGDPTSPAAGASVIVPEGALPGPLEIRITAAAGITLPGDPAAVVVRFEPAGTQFATDVAIGLSYALRSPARAEAYTVVHVDPSSGTITELPTIAVDEASQTMYAATSHFSYFALMSAVAEETTFLDTRNYKTYRTVTIGTQTWMAENLNYPNGNGACYASKQENCDVFGYHYNWQGAVSACPAGWKLPSDDDWKTLERYLGVPENELEHPNGFRGILANAGGRLKTIDYWKSPNEGATNETGFSALPAHWGYQDGTWESPKPNEHAYFWTSTAVPGRNDSAFARHIWHWDTGIQRGTGMAKNARLSVRCLKK